MNGFVLTIDRSYQKILALIASTIALSLVLLDSATFPLLLPTIQSDLGFSTHQMQWLINCYFLTTAALVIISGKFADIIGHRTGFCAGMALFALANMGIGLTESYYGMLVGRIVQGAAASLMGPTGLAILFESFHPKERGRAIGISAGFASLFMSIGPFFGATLIEFYHWRSVFFIYLPLALIGVVLARIAIPENKTRPERVDLLSCAYILVGIASMITALMQYKQWGVSIAFGCIFSIGLLFLVALYWRSRKQNEAFIDFSLFRIRHFTPGLIITFLTWVLMINPVFWSIFLQKTLFHSPVETASYIVTSTLPIILAAPASGLMVDRMGAQAPILIGFFIVLISVFVLILFTLYQSILPLVVAFCCFGIGTSLILTPLGNLCLSKIPAPKRGLASGIYNTMRFLGSAVGVVILSTINHHCKTTNYSYAVAHHSALTDSLSLKQASVLLSTNATAGLDQQTLSSIKAAVTSASFAGFSAINICNGFIVILALLLTLVYLKDYRETISG